MQVQNSTRRIQLESFNILLLPIQKNRDIENQNISGD